MSDRDEDKCMECDALLALHEEKSAGLCWTCSSEEDEEDFLTGKTCNPDEPELCESCQ